MGRRIPKLQLRLVCSGTSRLAILRRFVRKDASPYKVRTPRGHVSSAWVNLGISEKRVARFVNTKRGIFLPSMSFVPRKTRK